MNLRDIHPAIAFVAVLLVFFFARCMERSIDTPDDCFRTCGGHVVAYESQHGGPGIICRCVAEPNDAGVKP